ncbi:MAG: hypothetical protein LBN26_00330 [Christensenellaceae bacterium]|jgi:ABC-type sugar transport system substrate-binding protein|nr:hypothetical protein [Christensenellaceae bacterium]
MNRVLNIKRILPLLLCAALLCACAKPGSAEPQAAEETAPTPEPTLAFGGLLGFIIEDDGSIPCYMLMYGFLRTAENLGYPAKLYRAANGAAAQKAVEQAAKEGCAALLIHNPGGVNDAAVQSAIAAGLFAVVPYDVSAVEGLHCNVVADNTEYIEELSRGIAERMTERSLKSGRILVYGAGIADCYEKIQSAIAQYYPQYGVVGMEREAEGAAAIDVLAEYLLYNRDIKGIYAVDTASAPIVVQARAQAVNRFKGGAPTPSPTPSKEDIEAEPTATPNPALLTQISITVFACGMSDENLALFRGNDIYGLCIEPYYEAAGSAVMVMDKLLSGEETPAVARVNRPIVYADTIDKYTAIYGQVKEMFGLAAVNAN